MLVKGGSTSLVSRCGRAEMISETKRDVEVIGNERG